MIERKIFPLNTTFRLKPLDVAFMKAIHNKVNIVPVIAKADTLTLKERERLKKRVRAGLLGGGPGRGGGTEQAWGGGGGRAWEGRGGASQQASLVLVLPASAHICVSPSCKLRRKSMCTVL